MSATEPRDDPGGSIAEPRRSSTAGRALGVLVIGLAYVSLALVTIGGSLLVMLAFAGTNLSRWLDRQSLLVALPVRVAVFFAVFSLCAALGVRLGRSMAGSALPWRIPRGAGASECSRHEPSLMSRIEARRGARARAASRS